MKKLFALLVALSLCFAFVGCDNEDETIEVTVLFGDATLSYYDLNDEYFVFHSLRMDSSTFSGFNEIVGYVKKDIVHVSTKTLITSDPFVVGLRSAMRKCVPLNKSDMLLILRNHELPGLGTEDMGVLTLKKFPDFN